MSAYLAIFRNSQQNIFLGVFRCRRGCVFNWLSDSYLKIFLRVISDLDHFDGVEEREGEGGENDEEGAECEEEGTNTRGLVTLSTNSLSQR